MKSLLALSFLIGSQSLNPGRALADAATSPATAENPVVQASPIAPNSNEGWQEVDRYDNITIYRKEIPGNPVLAYKGTGDIAAPIAKLASVILDTPHKKEWMSRIKKGEVVRMISPNERIEYIHVGTPWPVKDRDFVYRTKMVIHPEKKEVVISYVSVEDPTRPEFSDKVRAQVYYGNFVMTPIDGGRKTHIEAEAHADPKGSIPKWIVNIYQKVLPRQSLEGLMKQVVKPWIQPNAEVQKLISSASSVHEAPPAQK